MSASRVGAAANAAAPAITLPYMELQMLFHCASARVIGLVLCAVVFVINSSCRAQVTEYVDRNSWESAVEEYTTIGFTGYPWGYQITDEYLEQGVLFTDGFEQVECCSFIVYPQDGSGLFGSNQIDLDFTQPMSWIAVDFPGIVQFDLYSDGELLYSSIAFGTLPFGNFAGLVSELPFDRAVISDLAGDVFIDDLHFGPSIPAPAVAPLLAASLLWQRRRRFA